MHTAQLKLLFILSISMLFAVFGKAIAAMPSNDEVSKKIGKLQVPFIANNGQMDEKVGFYAKTFGGTVFVTKEGEIVYSLPEKGTEHNSKTKRHQKEIEKEKSDREILKASSHLKGIAIKESLIDGKITEVKGEKKSETNVSYFKGNDSSKHKSNISAYDIVDMGEVYKGIELKLRAYGNNVEKLFYVKPGVDAKAIKMKVEGAKTLKVSEKGELEMLTELGTISFTKPVAYQEINGKRVEVKAEYDIRAAEQQSSRAVEQQSSRHEDLAGIGVFNEEPRTTYYELVYSFKLGNYDKTKELVIDPLLASALLDGNDIDGGISLAIDTSGNVFVTGYTGSSDFPTTPGAYNGVYGIIFVSKFNNTLTSLLSSTFIGGAYGKSIAIDASGNVFVTGSTESSDFPTTQGAYDTSFNGGRSYVTDAFISKFNNTLTTLLASTFLGGSNDDYGKSIAIDASGNVFVTGSTESSDFPTIPGAYDTSLNSSDLYYVVDVFVSKFNNTLTSLLASTFLGGISSDSGNSIAIDTSGNVFVTGDTGPTVFPTTPGAYNTSYDSGSNAFVSKFDNTLAYLLASTMLGGTSSDYGDSIAIDTSGNVFVTGSTYSNDFPATTGAYDRSFNGDIHTDAFVSKFNNTLTSLLASTFLGGSGGDYGYSIALDASRSVFVTGLTFSADFPTTAGAYDTSYGAHYDAFVSKFNNTLTTLLASTFYGGGYEDWGRSIAMDAYGNVFVTGTKDLYDTGFELSTYSNIGGAAFVLKFDGSLSNDCAATLSDDLRIHIPIAVYASNYYSVDMQYTTGLDFDLTGVNALTDTSTYADCLSTAPVVSSDLSIHMPVLMFDGVSYWADFVFKGNMTWTLTNAGAN